MSNKYIKTPEGFYQMSCRTRNMEQLIYHCEPMTGIKCEYETIKDFENKYLNLVKTNEKVLNLSKSTNENDEVKIKEDDDNNRTIYHNCTVGHDNGAIM